eukprot:1004125-Rhodomonas_salina.1
MPSADAAREGSAASSSVAPPPGVQRAVREEGCAALGGVRQVASVRGGGAGLPRHFRRCLPAFHVL